MATAFPLILLLVGLGLGCVLAVRHPVSVATANGASIELRQHSSRSIRWSTAGIICGIASAIAVSRWDSLGRGTLLAAPLFGLVVLAAVCLGEATARAPKTSQRQASLHTRRVRHYLPRRLTAAVVAATTVLMISLVGATLAGSSDDMGRAGRSLTVACPSGQVGSTGPWPGSFYAAPLLAMAGLAVVVAAAALLDTVRRPRLLDTQSEQPHDHDGSTTADDELRRRSARTVVAALGVAVAIPLSGVATFGAMALARTECVPPSASSPSTCGLS